MRRFARPARSPLCSRRAAAAAQVPVRAGYHARGTPRRSPSCPEINVTVTRTHRAARAGARSRSACSIATALQRGQPTVGIDEALNNIPGVVVSNRYNFSLDQRISIRGFGSRSNFGVRGLKILLDGIPQTLPDGQSQLTNVDFADIERAEVLRGASSSLYGNASGGVISLADRARRAGAVRAARAGAGRRRQAGRRRLLQVAELDLGAASGNASGTLSISQFKADGFRQHSAGEIRQLNAGVDYAFSGTTLGTAAAEPRRQPGGPESRRADARRVSSPIPIRPRPTTSSAAPTRTSSSSSSRSACSTSTPRGTSTR